LRTAEGKADCLILDHSDNHTRLDFVTNIHHDELDDGRERTRNARRADEALPKKCPKCSFMKPPKMHVCPCCGHIPVPQPRAVHRDGELVELDARKQAIFAEHDQRIFYAELKRIAETREYKPGWIAHKFKEKHGHFPPFDYQHLPSAAPSQATLRWVQSRNIAFAKRRGAA
jgi:DNA repair protein RadD